MKGRNNLMNIKGPCRDCQDRTQNCHSECERYNQYRDKLDRYNDLRNKHQQVEENYISYKRSKFK